MFHADYIPLYSTGTANISKIFRDRG